MRLITTLVKSVAIKAGKRVLTVLGTSLRTADVCAPFGDDSAPLNNATALFSETGVNGDAFVLGYKNKNQQAEPGEKRLYSLNADGSLAFYAWLKNDGTLELGGNTYHLVRYEQLQQALALQNTAINAELIKIQTAITSLTGTYPREQVNLDINESKIDEIKCL